MQAWAFFGNFKMCPEISSLRVLIFVENVPKNLIKQSSMR